MTTDGGPLFEVVFEGEAWIRLPGHPNACFLVPKPGPTEPVDVSDWREIGYTTDDGEAFRARD